MAKSEYALEVEGISKAYRIYGSPWSRIGEGLTLGRYRGHHEFWALKDVAFGLKPGSAMGLCGANGAGKSTLLKILAGTTTPTTGRYRMNGKVASLLELGAGFHMEFTGRANIFMNGIMMGFSRRELEARVDEIIEFAELGDYIDEPVRTYSSGMGLRLGFAVAVSVDPDVLIIDEVFAVGDMYFQKKCVDKIYEFKNKNKTILFCSHSLYDIRQLCDEALWLDQGIARAQGGSVAVTNEYTAFQRGHIGEAEEFLAAHFGEASSNGDSPKKDPSRLPSIRDARIYRAGTEEEAYELRTGDSLEIRIWWSNPEPQETPINIGVGFLRQDTTTCAGMGTHLDAVRLEGKEGCIVLKIPELKLLSGQFLLPVILFDEKGVHRYHEYLMPENLVIRTETRDVGLVLVDHSWEQPDLPIPSHRTGEAVDSSGDEAAADEVSADEVPPAGGLER